MCPSGDGSMTKDINVPEVGQQQVAEAFAFTDEVVEGYPGRLAGTAACRQAAERIKKEFEKFCDPGTAKAERCDIHPESFTKYLPWIVALYYSCVLLLFFIPALAWVSFILLALGLFAVFGQFVMQWRLLDPLFPRKDGYNVYGSIEPSGEVKQQVILSGHHDAAYVFHLRMRLPRLYAPLRIVGMAVMAIASLSALAAAILPIFALSFPQWAAIVLLILGIAELPFLFLTTNAASPGAGDDMMAVAVVAGVGRLFGEAKRVGTNPLRHTRLILLSFDAEECGLRGSYAWIKRHLSELKTTKTYAFNMDPMYKAQFLEFYNSDLSSRVKLSREMAQECLEIARSLGYIATIAPPRGGAGTDAANYGKAGIEATNLHGMSSSEKDLAGWVYHTPNDVSKYIEPELVEAALKIARKYILAKDAGV
jgi:aminopeptidase YwaD